MKVRMMKVWTLIMVGIVAGAMASAGGAEGLDFAPSMEEEQLPERMHSQMEVLPRVVVGLEEADFIGSDHRILQAAVDYVAGLGGGEVVIGPGEFEMRDSLHLRSGVVVRGTPGRTILRKATGYQSPLALDGDYGEEQITVQDPTGFAVGYGVAVWDDAAGGFHTTVARIIGRRGNTFALSRPLNADCLVSRGGMAATVFPVISGYHIEEAQIENLVVDGNRDQNPPLNGCRGAGIFLYRAHRTQIAHCTVRNYPGDGISFQQSNDVHVTNCVTEGNANLGIHPGSGSQRAVVRGNTARGNGTDGLFLCWRVRHGVFEDNTLVGNGRFGISIGHKDSDNLLRGNRVERNGDAGVFFRLESPGMAGHRNRLENNTILDNGAAGIRIRGAVRNLELVGNVIRDTRADENQTQTVGVLVEPEVGPLTMEDNLIEAPRAIEDQRPGDASPPRP